MKKPPVLLEYEIENLMELLRIAEEEIRRLEAQLRNERTSWANSLADA